MKTNLGQQTAGDSERTSVLWRSLDMMSCSTPFKRQSVRKGWKIAILRKVRILLKYMICGFIKYLHIKNNYQKLVVLVEKNISVIVETDINTRVNN